MLEFIRNSKRVVQVFLLLICIPFAFWGLDQYFRGGGGNDLVQIGKVRIGMNAFREALRSEQERMKAENPNANPADFDTEEVRKMVLDGLINRHLLLLEAQKRGLDVRLAVQQMIAQSPEFQVNGVFNQARYEAWLAGRGRNVLEFEAEVQQNLMRQVLVSSVFEGAVTPKTVVERIIASQTETREVQESLIASAPLMGKVEVTDAEIKEFYESNAALFTHPEQIQVEYVILAQNMLASKTKFAEAELRAWYDEHMDRFAKKPEERRLSHILLLTDDEANREKIQAESLRLLEEVHKDPSRFAALAKAHSQDPGSAAQGGDLGFMSRHALVKPFADAAFSMKKGDISEVVESEFGFHIIRVDDIRPGEYFPFAEVRSQVEGMMREQNMLGRFAEAAENFANLVYEESDSLQPAANAYGLTIQKSGWLNRESRGAEPVFNPKLLRAMFSDEVLKNGRNTEVVEVMPGVLAAARLLEHKPELLSPFAEVETAIASRLRAEKAGALAVTEGEAKLSAVREQDAGVKWGKSQTVSRLASGSLYPEALDAILKVSTDELPAYAGVALPGQGYALYKIVKADTPTVEPELVGYLSEQVKQFNAQNEIVAYLAALRQRYKVKVNEGMIREKE